MLSFFGNIKVMSFFYNAVLIQFKIEPARTKKIYFLNTEVRFCYFIDLKNGFVVVIKKLNGIF